MHTFEVQNDNNHVMLDDTQTCLHLKYVLKYSKNGLSMIPPTSVGMLPPNFIKGYYNTTNPSTGEGTVKCIRLQVPITKRDNDEFYLYSIHFPHETPSFATSEIMGRKDNDGVQHPLFALSLYVPNSIDIKAALEDLEVYVYSSKTNKKSNFGLEIFNEKSDVIFSSALHYMRVCDVVNKSYTSENKNPQDYYSEYSFPNVKKIGLTRIISASGAQCIAINGNTITTYINKLYTQRNWFKPVPDATMMYIVSELHGHQDFPVSLDAGEI